METIDQMTKKISNNFQKTIGLPRQNLVANFESPQWVTKNFQSPNMVTEWLATQNQSMTRFFKHCLKNLGNQKSIT
jgi:hypothetical protein